MVKAVLRHAYNIWIYASSPFVLLLLSIYIPDYKPEATKTGRCLWCCMLVGPWGAQWEGFTCEAS